jgi:hypothetical protein
VIRFIVGLAAGLVSGGIAWFFSHNVALTFFVGPLVAMTIWFTQVADDIVDAAWDMFD